MCAERLHVFVCSEGKVSRELSNNGCQQCPNPVQGYYRNLVPKSQENQQQDTGRSAKRCGSTGAFFDKKGEGGDRTQQAMSEKAPFTEYRIFDVLGNLAVGEP